MSCHVVETTSELSAFMEAGVMAGSERDAGFCSGGDEDDMSGLHSPSASEDSVEVQVTPISLRNKRKLAEPRKIQEPSTAPLKKRRFGRIEETVVEDEESRPATSLSPFRPWSTSSKPHESKMTTSTTTTAATVITITSAPTVVCVPLSPENRDEEEEPRRKHESMIQQEILLRIQESNLRPESPTQDRSLMQRREPRQRFEPPPATVLPPEVTFPHPRLQEEPLALVLRGEVPRVPSHPAVNSGYERGSSYAVDHVSPSTHHVQSHQPATQTNHSRHQQGGQQRNYKNMTRERRIEANARERTRVHTISAAFDTLRRAIPAYSHNQKLSKLSVLRIACSYIMTLSKIVNTPDGESANGATLGACVDLVSRTIQTEGKLRKRKED